jgi:glycosyltransferase involved in cell wall biosynthesis
MPDRLRVLFLIGSLGGGGSERQLVALLNALDRERFSPALYLLYRDGELLAELPDDITIHSFADQQASSGINFPGRALWQQRRHLLNVIRSHSVDIICERNWEMTLMSAAACRGRQPLRVAVIGSHPARDLSTRGGRFGFLKKRFLKLAYQRANRVVAVSDGVRRNAIEYYDISNAKVLTIHSYVDPDRVDRLAIAYQPDLPRDRFHIVAVGRLQQEKGYSFLLEALEQLVQRDGNRHLLLSIIGQGPLESQLKAQVRHGGLEQHVQFLGYLPNPIPYMTAADLYCLPSMFEGMPNALEEAVVCCTPVLATDCESGPAEILDGGRLGGLVPTGDADALAAAIADAMDNHDNWKERAQTARSFVTSHFSLKVGVNKFEQLFEAMKDEG